MKTRLMSFALALALSTSVISTTPMASARSADHFPPNLVADVAESVAPCVVNIDIARTQTTRMPNIPGFEKFLPQFGGIPPEGIDDFLNGPFQGLPGLGAQGFQSFGGGQFKQTIMGNGSGVIVDAGGYILTNNHVVQSATDIVVTLQDGRKLPAKVVGRDAFTDLAVLKVDATGLPAAKLGVSANLRPGEWVMAIGSPLGLDHTVTLGIVSAKARRVPDLSTNLDYIQTDAAMNPGNSGGPLVNLDGEVVGINNAISGKGQNIGFAIPIDTAKVVANTLIKSGSIARPWLGVSMTALTPQINKSLGLPESTPGVAVAGVVQNSPAQKAGFHQGDVIQRIDGQSIDTPEAVLKLVAQQATGKKLNVQVLRNGQMLGLPVTIEQMPDDFTSHR